ncbi:heparin/heparan-sulfate lyase [Mariniphaga anaerophila]|uniref:Heparin/heparan-sulfate lyase n=2 Tax=Mariniphaga anaerophila TaxID=1484053 RepID=A0A1M4WMJ5_9BACT|nr:heparin/heparan-sulfate lyase [Mariniphaga anaerophila]
MFFLFALNVFAFSQVTKCEWKSVNGVEIPIPPKEHPRLYIRAHQIPELKMRLENPALKDAWNTLLEMQEDWKPEDIPEEKGWRFYVQQKGITVRAELNALKYLVTKDEKLGREAINLVIDTLETASWPHTGDISRAVGRMMVSGAIVYDWCYDLLTDAEKQRFVKAQVRLAKMMECGYPPVKQNSVTGHSSEWMIMRDMISAGVAIYDEFPEMYNLAAGRFFKEHLPVRNWFYPGHAYHQGTSYFNVRFSCDLFALWIFDRMGAGNVYNPAQQFVAYDLIYKRRPDGQIMPSGDVNHTRASAKYYSLPMMLASSYYKDEYLNYEYQMNPNIDSNNILYDLLWRDTELGTKSPDDLPLTKYSGSPFGWMIARTGWDANSVIAEMKINEYNFLNHMHHDAGAFQIYYKGPLAIDAGTYQGSSGGYNSPHNKNFFKRTIAHNSLLIFDPDEKFHSIGYGGADKSEYVENDGGQRLPGYGWFPPQNLDSLLAQDYETGKILAHGFGPDFQMPDYSYLKGDITKAYSEKVNEVKRSFVFLNLKEEKIPAAFVVFDKVVASNPEFQKYWLLHSIEEPEIEGNRITIKRTKNGDTGMLVNTALLPAADDCDIVPVGGKGKEFWVFGTNYENESTRTADEANERGAWRVEILPKKPAAEDLFLNVMQVTETGQNNLHDVKSIENEKIVGAQLANRVVTFSKTGQIIDRPFELEVTGNGTFKFVLTDLDAGTWQVKRNGEVYLPGIPVCSDDGVMYFEGEAGDYKFLR